MPTESDPINFACPGCAAVLETAASKAGAIIKCPECGTPMEVPGPEPSASAAGGSPSKIIRRSSGSKITRRSGQTLSTRGGKARVSSPGSVATPPGKKKPAKKPVGLIVALLLLAVGLAGGGWWMWTRAGSGGGELSLVRAVTQGGGGRSVTPNAPLAAQAAPPRANRWNPEARANVTAFQWGGSGRDQVVDMVARQNGNMVLLGVFANRDAIPRGARHHTLLDDQGGNNFAYLAEVSADGGELLWVSTFGGELFEPRTMALAPDGSIAIGGRALDRMVGHRGVEGDFSGRRSVLGLVSSDGSRLLWMREGGPNQNAIEGIAVDAIGRVLVAAGGRGQGQRAYVLRYEADGTPSTLALAALGGNERWAINFDVRDPEFREPGQIGAFYAKGYEGDGYDYDGPQGPWGPVRWRMHGIRQGGSLVVLPDGDFIVAGTLQYDFREGRNRWFPAFDLIMARYNSDGELLWSTNLYEEGDSVHTPDQKDHHLIYNPVNGDVYILAIQHGSNIYRFKGELLGDTGNLMIGWVGRVDAATGALKAGWYWQSNRNGQYTERGSPRSPPHPQLSGNRPKRLAVDGEGRIYLAGQGSPRMFTTPNAWRDWPSEQGGGGNPALVVLSPELDRYLYATTLRGQGGDNGRGNAVIVNDHGVWVAGDNGTRNFSTGNVPGWSNPQLVGDRDAFLVNFRFH